MSLTDEQAAKLARFPQLAEVYANERPAKPRKKSNRVYPAKPVIHLATGTVYESAAVAAETLNIKRSSIYEAISTGKRFRRATDDEVKAAKAVSK